jgi:hypothetical protein
MSTYQIATFSRNDWHLVYTRLETYDKSPRHLAIRVESDGADKDVALWFTPDQHSGTVTISEIKITTPLIVQEFGWFKNVMRFAQLCETQPVPAGA